MMDDNLNKWNKKNEIFKSWNKFYDRIKCIDKKKFTLWDVIYQQEIITEDR